RLSDVALGLEHRHVVADGRRRDAQVMALHQRLGTDRFLGGDEVGDNGPQHLKPTVIGTSHWCHLLRYPLNPVHFTVSGAFDLTSGARADTKAPLPSACRGARASARRDGRYPTSLSSMNRSGQGNASGEIGQ